MKESNTENDLEKIIEDYKDLNKEQFSVIIENVTEKSLKPPLLSFFLYVSDLRKDTYSVLKIYSKLIELEPENLNHFYDRGCYYLKIKEWAEALNDFEHILNTNPKKNDELKIESLKKIVELYHNRKENETALRYFKKLMNSQHVKTGEHEWTFIEIFDEYFIKVIVDIAQDYELNGQYNIAKEIIFEIPEDGFSLSEECTIAEEIDRINKKQMKEEKLEAEEKAHKEMLSFFTHTLNNALGTGDNTIQDIIMDFERDNYIKNKEMNIYRLNSLFANFSLIRSLIKSYKIYIQDLEYFKKSWEEDSSGDADIDWVFVYTLRQVISQLLFVKDPKILNRLQIGTGNFNNKEEMKKENKRIRNSFINDVLLTKIDKKNVSEFLGWFTINLPFIKLEIKAPKLSFGLENIRFGLFFACFSEIINNALKYSDGKTPIELKWEEDSKYYIFQSRNTYNSETSFSNDIKEIKSQKGIHFIERLMNMFADSKIKSTELVKVDVDDNYFIFSVKYPKNKMN